MENIIILTFLYSFFFTASEKRNIARYVGVFSDGGRINLFSSLIKYLLSYLTGERLNQTKCERKVSIVTGYGLFELNPAKIMLFCESKRVY